MKLSVEIKDNKFIYDYKVGLSEQHGNMHLTAENFIVFSKLISDCCAGVHRDYKKNTDTIIARAYIEKNPDDAQAWIDRVKKHAEK